jgi:hypothetical protein
MKNKVILIAKKDCHFCEVLMVELMEIHKLKPYIIMDNVAPDLFNDFSKHFGVNRYPVIQIDTGEEFITIHMDKTHPGNNPKYILVEDIEHMLNKTLEFISE